MSSFSFPPGELAQQIGRRAMSQRQFAAKAELDETTISRAIRGEPLQARTWGRILTTLASLPVPEIPAGMTERSA